MVLGRVLSCFYMKPLLDIFPSVLLIVKYFLKKTTFGNFLYQSKYWHKPRLYLIRFCVFPTLVIVCRYIDLIIYIMCTWLTHSHKTGSRCSAWLLYSKEFRATTLPVSSDNNQYHVYWPSSMKNTSLLRVFWYLIFLKKKVFIKKIFIKKNPTIRLISVVNILKIFFCRIPSSYISAEDIWCDGKQKPETITSKCFPFTWRCVLASDVHSVIQL